MLKYCMKVHEENRHFVCIFLHLCTAGERGVCKKLPKVLNNYLFDLVYCLQFFISYMTYWQSFSTIFQMIQCGFGFLNIIEMRNRKQSYICVANLMVMIYSSL